jgi:5-methylcytosine-specific restriction endonuclease McrA
MRTLLLNASYEPLTVVSWKRAVALILADRAEVVHEADESLSSATATMLRPSVIRLKKYVKVPYRDKVPLRRGAVLARDRYECQFTHCDRRGTTIDHVHPRSKGGEHKWENVVAACQKCNSKKADKSLREMGWKLKREPVAPTGRYLLTGMKPKPEWEQYLDPA